MNFELNFTSFFFWSALKVFNYEGNKAILYRQLPISQRLDIISCLQEGDKSTHFLNNWRLTTL